MAEKDKIASIFELLLVSSVIAFGFALPNTIALQVVTGIGINLASNLFQGGLSELKAKWISLDGVLNHDIQLAFVRGFLEAISNLEKMYFQIEVGKILKREQKWAIEFLFSDLKKETHNILIESGELAISEDELRLCLYGKEEDAQGIIWSKIEEKLRTYDLSLKNFLRENLLKQTVFFFIEELKKDDVANNKAWRAFQMFLLDGLKLDLQEIKASQYLIQQDLSKLESIANDLGKIRQMIFSTDLSNAILSVKENTNELNENVKTIVGIMQKPTKKEFDTALFQREFSEVHSKLFTARNYQELEYLAYEIDFLLDKYPKQPELMQLQRRVKDAISFEYKELGVAKQASAQKGLGCFSVTTIIWITLLVFIALGIWYLISWIF